MAETLTRYDPFSSFTRLSDAMDKIFKDSYVLPRFFENVGDGFSTIASDLHETDTAYVVQMPLPGINPEKLDIRATGHELTIKGSFEIPPVEKGRTLRKGLMSGEFSEAFTLPAEIVGDKAEAVYKNGILTLTLPKAEKAQFKAIPVKVTP